MSLPPSYNLLKQYPNKYFVETGSFRGDAIQSAIDAGFENIISIDISLEQSKFCFSRFDLRDKQNPLHDKIRLYTGDSATELYRIIGGINQPITFWLDAHWQMDESPKGENPFPLFDELRQIGRHQIKTHTIIIDDFIHLSHPDVTGWRKGTIFNEILNINPNYKIKLIPNPKQNDICIATV